MPAVMAVHASPSTVEAQKRVGAAGGMVRCEEPALGLAEHEVHIAEASLLAAAWRTAVLCPAEASASVALHMDAQAALAAAPAALGVAMAEALALAPAVLPGTPPAGERSTEAPHTVLPYTVLRIAALRIAALRIAALRIAAPRIAVPRIAVPRIAVPHTAVPRTAVPDWLGMGACLRSVGMAALLVSNQVAGNIAVLSAAAARAAAVEEVHRAAAAAVEEVAAALPWRPRVGRDVLSRGVLTWRQSFETVMTRRPPPGVRYKRTSRYRSCSEWPAYNVLVHVGHLPTHKQPTASATQHQATLESEPCAEGALLMGASSKSRSPKVPLRRGRPY